MECSLYDIKFKNEHGSDSILTFYSWKEGAVSKALCLGFPPMDECAFGPEDAFWHRIDAIGAARTVSMKSTIMNDREGNIFNEHWQGQAALSALWRQLESLSFVHLPENPFLGERPPDHIDLIDFQDRFKYFSKKKRLFKSKNKGAGHNV